MLLEFLELFFNSMEKGDVASVIFLNFYNYFQWRKMTWHEMMWHTCMLRELKLMTCNGS
jgi:hypothetical protein